MIIVKPSIVGVVVAAGLVSLVSVRPVWATTANDICNPSADPCRVTTRVTVTDQSIIDVGTRELRIEGGGALAAALGAAAAGNYTVRAGRLTILNNGALLAEGSASRNGGEITVEAGEITVDGRIAVTGGSGGSVSLTGTGRVTIGGSGTGPTITVSRLANEGEGGELLVRGGTVVVTGNVEGIGGLSGFGGDITINSTGDLTVSGDINAEGGDGGTVELSAGVGTGAGNIVVERTSFFDTDAKSAGGFGGSVDFDARGDGTATGNVTFNGTITCNGGTGNDETGGGDGGSIGITAVGDVITNDDNTVMEVQGGRPDGFGGEFEVLTSTGNYSMVGRLVIGPLGEEGSGGDVTVDIGGDILLDGRIEGPGSELLIEADGSLTIENDGEIDISETGSLDLGAGAGLPGVLGRILIRGPLSANAGTISISARDAATLSAPIRADGPTGGGPGGSVQVLVEAGPAILNNTISVRATGGASDGGVLTIDAEGRVSVVGTLDATGAGTVGGMIGVVSAAESVDIPGTIRAGATGSGRGGTVEIMSAVDLTLSGTIRVDGGSPNGAGGGTTELTSCSVRVNESGVMSSVRPTGVNRIIGRRETLVLGTMTADNQTGLNEFVFRAAQNEPVIFGNIRPTQTLRMDPSVTPCVECGNGNTEPPEECDDGNQEDGDGCSRTCTEEEILVGDANGDLVVDEADIDAIVAEIFDGDGDSVADVASPEGAFPGTPGADANENERVEVADLSALVGLLVP